MPPVRTMYTREELLRIASLASAMDLGPEVLRKFDVIEVAEPVPGPKRRESELNFKSSVLTDNFSTSTAVTTTGPNGSGNTGGKANHSSGMNGGGSNNHTSSSSTPGYSAGGGRGCDNRRGGGNGGRDDSGSGSFKQSGYDRFAPPEGRFSRGSRNQETFEEGIEYELRQSALQKKRVAETMEREDRKGEHLRQALEKFKQEGNDAAAAEAERETDEIERLLAGITMIDDAPKTVVRSRFFSAQGPMTASAEPPTAMPLPPPPPAATTLSFGTTASSSAPATTGVPQASVLATPAKSGTPGYATGPWSSMKSDSNLWSTAPSMASALKQSLQQPSSPAATSPPLQIRSQQPALQQSQPPTRPASDPQPGKSMGTVAAATSTNSVSAQSSSGSGGFGVHAPAQASLPAPPQGSVLGSASGNSNTGIGAAIGGKAGVPTSAGQPQGPPHTSPQTPSPNLPQASRPAPATATKPAPRSGGSTGVPTGAWSAAELEFLLKKGTAVKSSAPALPSSTGASATTAQKTQPITAAELESLLMKRARQGSGATGTGMSTLPPSPPQFQQPPPPQQASLLFANPAKTPTMPANSNPAVAPLSLPQQLPASMMAPNGAMLTPKQPLPPPPPPMPSQMPTHPQPQPPHHSQPQQHQQSPWVAMPRPPQAPPASQPSGNGSPMHNTPPLQPLAAKMQHPASMMPNGLQMPMQMNPQGQYFVDSAQLQRVYMTGQPMMFRRPDGTVFMQTQHMAQPQPQQAPPHPQQPFNPFGTNAQFLFQQQQRR